MVKSQEEVVRLAIRNKALGHASIWELDRNYTGDSFWIDNDLPEQELYWEYSWNLVGEETDNTGAKYSFDCGTGMAGITLSLSGDRWCAVPILMLTAMALKKLHLK